MNELVKDLPSMNDFINELKPTVELCKHCNLPVQYDAHDAVYFHKILSWGHSFSKGSINSRDYNNGYWCQEECKTSAFPKKAETQQSKN